MSTGDYLVPYLEYYKLVVLSYTALDNEYLL